MKKNIVVVGIAMSLLILCFTGCTSNQPSNEKNKENSGEEYLWSTMDQGPYRDKISYATSTDLTTWTDSQQVLAEHASVPGALIKDGTIYVYFVDVSQDGIPEQIGVIKSLDNGQTWTTKEIVSFEGVSEKVPVDPAPFLLDDGRIRLYYYDINEARVAQTQTENNKIYSALSSDGVHFIQEPGVRFERQGIFDPDVIKVNNTWRMYVGDITGNKVISATSSDGLLFTEEGIALDGGAVPDVFYYNETYYLYTAGIDISRSSTGASFIKTTSFFRSQLGMVTADPSVIELNNGSYIMLYKTK